VAPRRGEVCRRAALAVPGGGVGAVVEEQLDRVLPPARCREMQCRPAVGRGSVRGVAIGVEELRERPRPPDGRRVVHVERGVRIEQQLDDVVVPELRRGQNGGEATVVARCRELPVPLEEVAYGSTVTCPDRRQHVSLWSAHPGANATRSAAAVASGRSARRRPCARSRRRGR
jgi:hypothetical protein